MEVLLAQMEGRERRADGGMNGGQEKECRQCGGRERQITSTGHRRRGRHGVGGCSVDGEAGGSRAGTHSDTHTAWKKRLQKEEKGFF